MATGGGQGAPHQVTCLGLNVCVANPIPRALSALCCRARNVKHFPLVPREIVYNTLLAFPTLNNVRGGRLGILPASPTVCCTGILSRPIFSCGFYPTACGSSNCEQKLRNRTVLQLLQLRTKTPQPYRGQGLHVAPGVTPPPGRGSAPDRTSTSRNAEEGVQ